MFERLPQFRDRTPLTADGLHQLAVGIWASTAWHNIAGGIRGFFAPPPFLRGLLQQWNVVRVADDVVEVPALFLISEKGVPFVAAPDNATLHGSLRTVRPVGGGSRDLIVTFQPAFD